MNDRKQTPVKEAPDYAFRRACSLHKVWIGLKNGTSKTHYAKDCSATIAQLQWKKVNTVVFSYEKSLEDCFRLEEFFRGKYYALQIYRRGADGKFPDEPIIKYVKGKLEKTNDDTIPEDVFYQVLYAAAGEGLPFDFKLQPIKKLAEKPVEALPVKPQTSENKKNAAFAQNRIDQIARNWNFK